MYGVFSHAQLSEVLGVSGKHFHTVSKGQTQSLLTKYERKGTSENEESETSGRNPVLED